MLKYTAFRRSVQCCPFVHHSSCIPAVLPSCHTSERRIFHTATSVSEACNRAVVGPACKLLLHRLREHRAIHVRIGRCFLREFAVEVGGIQRIHLLGSVRARANATCWSTYHVRFEGRVVFPLKQLSPVDAVEERMRLDLRRAFRP